MRPQRGGAPAGSWAGWGLLLEATWAVVFSSHGDGRGDRAPSLPLLGGHRGKSREVGPAPSPISGLQALFPPSLLSLCPPHPPSFIFPPLPRLLSQLPAEGQVTLLPVALHSRDSRASGSSHRGQRDRKARRSRPGLAKRVPGGRGSPCSRCRFPDPGRPPWAGEIA